MAIDDGRDEFINQTQGWVGAVQINRKGDDVAVAVEPGASVFLNEEERELTARAHKRAQDSPFEPRPIVFYDPETRDEKETRTIAPLERAEKVRATGAAEEPVNEPPKGQHAPDEEVGTPDAPAKPKRSNSRRRKPATANAG